MGSSAKLQGESHRQRMNHPVLGNINSLLEEVGKALSDLFSYLVVDLWDAGDLVDGSRRPPVSSTSRSTDIRSVVVVGTSATIASDSVIVILHRVILRCVPLVSVLLSLSCIATCCKGEGIKIGWCCGCCGSSTLWWALRA